LVGRRYDPGADQEGHKGGLRNVGRGYLEGEIAVLEFSGVVDFDYELASGWFDVCIGHSDSRALRETHHRLEIIGSFVERRQRFNGYDTVAESHRVAARVLITFIQLNPNGPIEAAYTRRHISPIHTHIIFFNSTGRTTAIFINQVPIITRQIEQYSISAYLLTSKGIISHEISPAANHQGLWGSVDVKG
jgi:hypothetical protein